MKEFENNAYFWQKIETLLSSGDIKILAKKGTPHPQYSNLIYPVDYGTVKMLDNDESNIEIFKGKGKNVDAVILVANILTKNFETKVLIGLSDEEEEEVLRFLNCTEFQKGVILRRGKEIPSWATAE